MEYALIILAFLAGVVIGGYLLRDSRPRPLLRAVSGGKRLDRAETAGLLASVLVQKAPALIPKVILETDKTIVIEHPRPRHKVHYLFISRKDIKNIGELTDEDSDYLVDLYSAVVEVINKQQLGNYRLWTNGPGKQDVAYLHFHLGAD